jgi:hypothetical protein
MSLDVDGCESPEALYTATEGYARREAARHAGDGRDPAITAPVVELALEGVLAFDHHELDLKRLEALVQAAFEPLLVRIANRSVPTEYEVGGDEAKSRAELERDVVEDLVERDARYRPAAANWAEIILNVKRMALEETSPQSIVEYLSDEVKPLVGLHLEQQG